MSNPDNIPVISVDVLSFAVPVGILFVLLTMYLFQIKGLFPSFYLILWIGLPLLAYIVTTGVNMITQYITCKKLNTGRAFLGALPVLGTMLLGLGIASMTVCRIPVASVIAPMVIGRPVNVTKDVSTANLNSLKNSTNKECCTPKLTLESIEDKYPIVSGLSYGFYIMFSMLFGIVLGNGMANVC
jgi:hypothetical protein